MQSSDILNNTGDLKHENKLSLATDEKTLPENMYVFRAELQQQMLRLKKRYLQRCTKLPLLLTSKLL